MQTFFQTLFIGITFHGLLALSIERFIRYQNPIWHINTFTMRLEYDENDKLKRADQNNSYIVFIIIAAIWILNIFISLIPLFNNINDLQYFATQSQCDYVYENFNWWLWLFFFLCIAAPFVCCSVVFFVLTFRLIYLSDHGVKMRRTQFELDITGDRSLAINEAEHDQSAN